MKFQLKNKSSFPFWNIQFQSSQRMLFVFVVVVVFFFFLPLLDNLKPDLNHPNLSLVFFVFFGVIIFIVLCMIFSLSRVFANSLFFVGESFFMNSVILHTRMHYETKMVSLECVQCVECCVYASIRTMTFSARRARTQIYQMQCDFKYAVIFFA